MQRRLGFLFALGLVAAAIGFSRFTGPALGTVMRVLFVALLLLILAAALFGRRGATS